MLRYLLKRTLGTLPLLLLALTLGYMLAGAALPGRANGIGGYVAYLGGALSGAFGYSQHYQGVRASELVAAALPSTLVLAALTGLIALIFGLLGGALAARHEGRGPGKLLFGAAFVMITLPAVVLGPYLAQAASALGLGGYALDLVLAALTLGLPLGTALGRQIRSELLAHKGQPRYRHQEALRGNKPYWPLEALPPVLAEASAGAALILLGSFLVENMYGISGMGAVFIDALRSGDRPVLLACSASAITLTVLIGLASDLISALIVPASRAGQGA